MIEEYILVHATPLEENSKPHPCYGLASVTAVLHTALWGKLSCLILMGKWDLCPAALQAVRHGIHSLSTLPSASPSHLSPLRALQERTWLLHWSLFVHWNAGPSGLHSICDLFFDQPYMQAIQTNAPWLLRYLTAAVVCGRKKRMMGALVSAVRDQPPTDPLLNFVSNLYGLLDFSAAQSLLQPCESALKADFFLQNQASAFMNEARVRVFESYCRIHSSVSIPTLARQLAMDEDDAERWLADVVLTARIDARIDAKNNTFNMSHQTRNVYQSVIDRTKDLNVRCGAVGERVGGVVEAVGRERRRRSERERED